MGLIATTLEAARSQLLLPPAPSTHFLPVTCVGKGFTAGGLDAELEEGEDAGADVAQGTEKCLLTTTVSARPGPDGHMGILETTL